MPFDRFVQKSKAQKRVWDQEDKRRTLIEQLKEKEENEAKVGLVFLYFLFFF